MIKRNLLKGIIAGICTVLIGTCSVGAQSLLKEATGSAVQLKANNGATHYFKPYDWINATYYDGNLEEGFKMTGIDFHYGLKKDNWRDMTALFNLNKKISNVSFTIGHIDNDSSDTGVLKVYLDGVIQDSYTMNLKSDMVNCNVSINTSGYKQLKIIIAGDDAKYGMGNIMQIGAHEYDCEVTKVATVSQDGLFTYKCKWCGDKYTVVDKAKKYCENYLEPYQTDNVEIWKENYASSKFLSVMGEKVYRGIKYTNWRESSAMYNLSGAYNSVNFTVGHTDKDDRDGGELKVFVDGREVRNIPLTWDMINESYRIDTMGATQLKFLVSGDAYYTIFDLSGDPVDKSNKEHTYEEQALQEAEFGIPGTMRHVCSNCGAFYTTEIPALNRYLTDDALNISLKRSSYTFNGKAKKPGLTVTYGGENLVKNKDYKVSYSKNVKAGIATVTVKGLGFYKKSSKATFYIYPAKTKMSSVRNVRSHKAVVSIKKNSQAKGYEVQYASSSSFWYASTAYAKSKRNVKIRNLAKGYTYYFRARAYKTVKGTKLYGDYGPVKKLLSEDNNFIFFNFKTA